MLPDHQKVEGKFKLRIVMAGFHGQIEIFLLGRIEPPSGVWRKCGVHTMWFQGRWWTGEYLQLKDDTYLYLNAYIFENVWLTVGPQ